MDLRIDCTGVRTGTITQYLVDKISAMIRAQTLPPGSRLPSIRRFAERNGVSRFTTVQVYDRLVASGVLQSRPGAGFFVRDEQIVVIPDEGTEVNLSALHLATQAVSRLNVSAGTLPGRWLNTEDLQRAVRKAARQCGEDFAESYSAIEGYGPLREQIRLQLTHIGVNCDISQIMTTSGAVSATDLIIRTCVKPGDTVLCDDPGYMVFRDLISGTGAKLIALPRTPEGLDLEALATVAEQHRPVLFYTSSVNHNPTGQTLNPQQLHATLRIAERYDFRIIDDDSAGFLHADNPLCFASLDGLERVFHVNSYSKNISGRLRVGYVATPKPWRTELLRKRLLGARASELAERVVYEILTDGGFRKHQNQLLEHVNQARERSIALLREHGFEFFHLPANGPVLWARPPGDTAAFIEAARKADIDVLFGTHFYAERRESHWIRLAVAHCISAEFVRFIQGYQPVYAS